MISYGILKEADQQTNQKNKSINMMIWRAREMSDCIFCKIVAGAIPCRKICEDEQTLAFMDIANDVDGHIVVIPKAHYKNILDCAPDVLNAVIRSVQKVSMHLTRHCGYGGVNLLNASDESAGQSVPHFHIHLIPRKQGDQIDAWPDFKEAKQDIDILYQQLKMDEV